MPKYLPENDTIVALSTPLGSGAIAVIRLSGPDAVTIAAPFLSTQITTKHIRRAIFTEFSSTDSAASGPIDQVVATWFQAPESYTGEDVLEISCHCNPLIIDQIIESLCSQGARIAEPGEFTFRSFMNGKLDLSQAEAVADIINARSRQSLNQSMRHLEGRLTDHTNQLRDHILGFLSLVEISLDFSEEEIELIPYSELDAKIVATIAKLEELVATYSYGRLLQEGIKLLILGKPNVGKSSLLNALLERNRAIVSDIPGTTRDYIEANLEIDGLAVQAVDTAGVRDTDDIVEAAGVERTLEQLETSDIAICVFNGHEELSPDDQTLIEVIKQQTDTAIVCVLNKSDLGTSERPQQSLSDMGFPIVRVSAINGDGLSGLKRAIKNSLISDNSLESEELVITSARHKQALEATIAALSNVREAIKLQATEEILAVDIRLALDHLGEITGETTADDVLNHIFSSFCIGK